MNSKSEEIMNRVVFIVARLIFGTSLAQQEATQNLVRRALISHNLHKAIAEILGECE